MSLLLTVSTLPDDVVFPQFLEQAPTSGIVIVIRHDCHIWIKSSETVDGRIIAYNPMAASCERPGSSVFGIALVLDAFHLVRAEAEYLVRIDHCRGSVAAHFLGT